MPPTIQSGERKDRERKSRSSTGPARSDIVCRVKYANSLPDIPFDPKFITYPFEANRFVQYNATSLERNYKHELLAEHDLGVTIDLINPDTYRIPEEHVELDPADEKLLEEEIATPGDSKRSRQHSKTVSWLRKTEYISSEYNRSQHSKDKIETKVGHHLKKQFTEENLYKDRSNQISAIQKTFEDAKKPIETHYSKPHVTPVEILPVFPDFETWIHPCAQVIFDSDPALRDKSSHQQLEEMSQAMIRGMVDESEEQFVGYFLPTEETCRKRKRDFEEDIDYVEGEEYEYKLTREYNWNVKNKASRGYEENYFFVFRKGKGVFYNELETRVRLSKRRVKDAPSSNSLLVVKHRELFDQESAMQDMRMNQLENVVQEEEEEEEEEVEMEVTEGGEGEEQEEGEEGAEGVEGESQEEEEDGEEKETETEQQDSDAEQVEEAGSGEEEEQEAEEEGEEMVEVEEEEGEEQMASGSEQEAASGEEEEEEEQVEREEGEEEEEEEEEDEDRGKREVRDEEEIFGDSDSEEEQAGEEEEEEEQQQESEVESPVASPVASDSD
ncbi:RNA polymerase II-associated factor 1 homolog [Strongylocentrotus purpuratus]|uniref:RNA polymerase II-associated factor 1 homolog n=1 Tax=Strongylocentrotus purpuratus TaxID=7668 RepID=A0A7M7RGE6_STRPU|nr:RNA polymerase II-associated factor 1 homolog [Strongylocentrotus purpuratus]|eukprot:XP_785518.3 PREDICTED: RNA polymerase II-associated factor 1 homolog [Strongylocentrotus purpuratus]